MGTTAPRLSAAEVKELFEKLSNWGRWGKDDERGALNFITPQKRTAAGRLVQSGETVSMALPLATTSGPDNPTPVTHVMLYSGPGLAVALDYFAIAPRSATSSGSARCTTASAQARSDAGVRANAESTSRATVL